MADSTGIQADILATIQNAMTGGITAPKLAGILNEIVLYADQASAAAAAAAAVAAAAAAAGAGGGGSSTTTVVQNTVSQLSASVGADLRTVTGTAPAGTVVTLSTDNFATSITVTADSTGRFTYVYSTPLAQNSVLYYRAMISNTSNTPSSGSFTPYTTTLPDATYVLDPALPTTLVTPTAPSIQVDSSSNVLAVMESKSNVIFSHGYGEALLRTGGPGGFPYFHCDPADCYHVSFDSLVAPAGEANKFFVTAGQSWTLIFVMRQTGVAGNGLLKVRTTQGDAGTHIGINLGLNVHDGSMYVEQNNGAAFGGEPSSAGVLTAINQLQIVCVQFDGSKFLVFRNGTQTFQSPSLLSTQKGFPYNNWATFEFLNNAQADVSLIVMSRSAASQTQLNTEFAALAARYGVTGLVPVTQGLTTQVAALTVPVEDFTQEWITTPNFPSAAPLVIGGTTLGNGLALAAGATPLCNYRFGSVAGANVPNRATLDAQFYFNPWTGNQNNVVGSDGIEGVNTCYARARRYPTTNQFDLHTFGSAGLTLGAVGSQNNTVWGYGTCYGAMIRSQINVLPGMCIKIRAQGPSNPYSWLSFWLFGGTQFSPLRIAGAGSNPYAGFGAANSALQTPYDPNTQSGTTRFLYYETDIDDNFGKPPITKGKEYDFGVVRNGAESYNQVTTPYTSFIANSGGVIAHPNTPYPPYAELSTINKSVGIHEYVLNWRTDGFIEYFLDGILIARQYKEFYTQPITDPITGAATQVGMHLLITNQAIPNFLGAANPLPVADRSTMAGTIEEISIWKGNVDQTSYTAGTNGLSANVTIPSS